MRHFSFLSDVLLEYLGILFACWERAGDFPWQLGYIGTSGYLRTTARLWGMRVLNALNHISIRIGPGRRPCPDVCTSTSRGMQIRRLLLGAPNLPVPSLARYLTFSFSILRFKTVAVLSPTARIPKE